MRRIARPKEVTGYVYGTDEYGRCAVTVSPQQEFEIIGIDDFEVVLTNINEPKQTGLVLEITRHDFNNNWEEL